MKVPEAIVNDKFANFVGIKLLECGDGSAFTSLKLEPQHMNGLGRVHGAVIYAIAYYTFAAGSNSRDHFALALDTHITFIKAVSGTTLFARCRELGLNRRTAFYAVDVTDDTDTLIATFHGTAYLKPHAAGS
jgi:acyl-CoA thioesterase